MNLLLLRLPALPLEWVFFVSQEIQPLLRYRHRRLPQMSDEALDCIGNRFGLFQARHLF